MRLVIVAPPTIDVSALAKDLAAREKAILVPDPSRAACERYGFQTLYEMPLALQKQARRKLITDHIAALKKNGSAVYDHSIFQWLADWMRWLWSETPSEEWEAVLAEAVPAIPLYDRIEHVPAGPPAGYDGYRWLDARNGKQIDRLLRHLYEDLGCADRVQYAALRGR
jgi:hypothetical protein